MFLKRYLKSKPFLLAAMLLLLFLPPPAWAEEEVPRNLVESLKGLVLAIEENNFLMGSNNYSSSKSDFAATIERDDVQKFFKSSLETSKNSAEVITGMNGLAKAVDGLSLDMRGLAENISIVRQSDSAQSVDIMRNRDELKDIRYFLGWLIVTLLTAIPSAHVYVHRNDNRNSVNVV